MRRILGFKSILLFICSVFLFPQLHAQQQTVTGKVTDAQTGSPLPGATVVIANTNKGTSTDMDGNYQIQAEPGNELTYSFIGYESKTVILDNQTNIDVSLSSSTEKLDEVVVIGYGTVKKEDATGSVSVVSADDFNSGTNNKPQDLILGKIPGVVVTPSDGAPTSAAQIRIRGGSSLNASNDPLIVIDGLPVTNEEVGGAANLLALINPDDIESMTILKDASATAIYGVRASNGVIIITTKKGSKGPLKINYTSNVSLSAIAKKLEVLNGNEFRQVVEDQVANHDLSDFSLTRLGTANTDWQDEIYREAISTDHNLSISGSPGNIPLRASFGYNYTNGILDRSGFDRLSGSLNANPKFLEDHLTVGVNVKVTGTKNRYSNTDAISSAIEFDPTQPVQNGNTRYGGLTAWTDLSDTLTNGDININGIPNNIATHNPVARIRYRDNTSDVFRSLGNVTFDYKLPFLPELRANLNLGYDYIKSTGDDITDTLASWSIREPEQNVKAYENTHQNHLLDFYLNYVKNVESLASNFDVTAGYSYQYLYKGKINKNRPWLANEEGVYVKSDTVINKWENVLVSFFGRLNYSLLDKYLLTATLRADGTSRFSENNRWGTFPSFSLAWKINNEPFLKNVKGISELKLRAGWGITGQQDVGNKNFRDYYPYLAAYEFSEPGASYQRGNEFIQTFRPGPYNSDLRWEQTTTQNIGLDFGFAQNRITGNVDVYNRETKDLISEIPIAVGTNFSNTLITNVGSLTNKGIEANINAIVLSSQDLRWQVGVNFSYNKNEITKLTAYNDSTYLGVDVGAISGGVDNKVQKHMIGYPAYTFFLFKQVYGADGMPIEGLYVDKTGNGGDVSGNNANKYYSKKPAPDYVFGINTSFQYKQIDFSFSGHANVGNYVYNNNNSNRALFQNIYNQSGYLANIPESISETEFQTAQYWSDIYLENASFFRMDNITVGYTFNNILAEKLTGRVSFTVNNAFVITKYSGIDPEISDGIDKNLYPRPRTFILGLNIDF